MSADAPRTASRLSSGVSFGGRSFQVMSEWVNGVESAIVAAFASSSSFGAALQVVDKGRGGQPAACQVLTNRAPTFRAGDVAGGEVNANDAVTSTHSARHVASIIVDAIACFLLTMA